MSKQVQDAYIVAATRTPIGKSRARLLPQHAARRPAGRRDPAARWRRCRALDPKAIEDAIIGCAMPEAEQGMNMARIGALLAGLPQHGRRRHGQPLLRLGPDRGADGGRPHPRRRGRRDDRRRRREHEHGADGRQQAVASTRRSSRATRTSASPTAWASRPRRWPRSGRSAARRRTRSRWQSHQKALAAQQAGEFADEIDADRGRRPLARPGHRRASTSRRAPSSSTKARAPTPRSKAWPSCKPVFAAKGTRHRRQQLADQRRRRRADPGEREGRQAVRPEAAGALRQLRERAACRREIMGIGPIEAIPAALQLRRPEARRHRLDRAQRSVRRAVAGGDQHASASTRPRSTRWAARSRSAIRSAPPARSARRPSCTRCAASKLKYGMVTMCVGTGQGAAGIFERV